MRIGFFGGSFDPPHRGHLALALAAADQFLLDKVLLAPVGVQALKQNQPVTAFPHRYAMIALAAQADPRLLPSLLDAPLRDVPQKEYPSHAQPDSSNNIPNYTIDTLTRLRQTAGGQDSFFTLLGADSILGIRNWHQPERLLAQCDWIVAARPRFEVGDALATATAALPVGIRVVEDRDPVHGAYLRLLHASGANTRVWFLPHLHEDISATALRAAIHAGTWDASLVPAPVAEYIRKTGVYGTMCGTGTKH
ncbi:MAG TPA: adenylyltransferase/cytidyltransferase family protein [Acidobacteriaceae bacterium]|jgi:nicotinate-nucleotide adenylyltransferase|nr:adenylyltransferase/cytidyltransferase family protein [Acidobacteriaceae bacterium]